VLCCACAVLCCNPTLPVTWRARGPHALSPPLIPATLLCYSTYLLLHITHNQSHAISLSHPSFLVCPLHNFYFILVAEKKQKAPLIVILPGNWQTAHTSSCYPYLPRGKGLANARNDLQEALRGDQWRFLWFLATHAYSLQRHLLSLGPQKSVASKLSHATP
jgi:hypothetical protein